MPRRNRIDPRPLRGWRLASAGGASPTSARPASVDLDRLVLSLSREPGTGDDELVIEIDLLDDDERGLDRIDHDAA